MLSRTCTEHSEVPIMLRNELRQYHPRRASRIIFLRWQISRGRKKERVAWTNTSYEKHKRGRRTGASKAPERTCQPGGSTENDDRPLFPPSGLNYYHPAEHCLLWRRIILLSLGRPDSNTLGEGLREGDGGGGGGEGGKERCRREREYTRGRMTVRHPAVPRFIDLTRKNHRVMKNKSWFVENNRYPPG